MLRIEFNLRPVLDRLARGRAALADLTPVHQDIREAVVQSTKRRFIDGRGPDGRAWQAKQPSTLAAYLRRGDGHRPDPLIGPSGRLGKEIVGTADATNAEIGSALEYSGVMQSGARKGAFGSNRIGRPIPWGDIPARPFLGISADDERTIIDIVDEHLDEGLDG